MRKERSVLLPAQKNTEPVLNLGGVRYIGYQLKLGGEGVGAPVGGNFPKPVKHVARLWNLQNQFGAVTVQSTKAASLLVPANTDLVSTPGAPDDATHFICYQVKPAANVYTDQTPGTCDSASPANADGACMDDADCGGSAGQHSLCLKPKFLRNLQSYFLDQFDDCALNAEGDPSFAATAAEGRCLFDIKKIRHLCNPVQTSEVMPTRESSATISPSIPTTTKSLLCYQPGLGSKFKDTAAASTAMANVGDSVDPKQRKHLKRRIADGNPLFTTPGSLFPAPDVVDTSKQELVCVPTEVVGISAVAP